MAFWRHRPPPLTTPHRDLVRAAVPHVERLSATEAAQLERSASDLLHRASWEAARGSSLDEDMRATIAGRAALLTAGFDRLAYPHVSAIVVHPTTILLRGARPGPIPGTFVDRALPVLGHTRARGPVHLAWDIVAFDSRHPERGHDVVLHEFAHQLDVADGTVDGTPLVDRVQRRRWIEVCQSEYDQLRAGDGSPLLRDYAMTSPGEFFAVATEVFFGRPGELGADRPDLYDVLAAFYRQDPATRAGG